MLTPEDILKKDFPSSGVFTSGYVQIEVDAFLDEVVLTMYQLQQEIDKLKAERDALLQERYGHTGQPERTGQAGHTPHAAPTEQPPQAAEPQAGYGGPSAYPLGGHTE